EQTQAAVPATLAAAALQTAKVFTAGHAASAAQAQVFQLAEGAMRTMFTQKFVRIAAALSLLLALAGAGIGAAHLLADSAKPQAAEPVIHSVKSGAWSAPTTWEGGKVPGAGARVQVRPGHEIVYDVNSDQVIRGINVAGALRFAADKNTRLDVGL